MRAHVLAIALGLVLGTAAAPGAAAPATAAPGPAAPGDRPVPRVSVPSAGARPVAGPPVLSAGPPSALLTDVRRRTAEVERLGETLSEHESALAAVRAELAERTRELAAAEQSFTDAQVAAGAWARRAYMDARRMPDPLAVLPRPVRPDPGVDLDGALATVDEVRSSYAATGTNEQRIAAAHLAARTRYDTAAAALADLQTRNASRLAADQAMLDTRRQQAGDAYLASVGIPGGSAAPAALRAVSYALAQRGKPYVWGAEGPDTFDCSGLVQAAYGSAGIRLPRTARPQWRATPAVATAQMIPGDLLFFATDASNWDSIHHVGIYLGGGKMIHAPQSGDVVRIAPVWWEEFFGATRVVAAVDGPSTPVKVPPKPKPKPKPAPKPPSKPPPKPSPSAPHSPSPSPSTSPSAGSPSASPSTSASLSVRFPLYFPVRGTD